MILLVINCGSSSIKYQLFEMPDRSVLVKGVIEKIGMNDSFVRIVTKDDQDIRLPYKIDDHRSGIEYILGILTNSKYGCLKNLNVIDAVGHRVGHGGTKFKSAVRIDDSVLSEIEVYNDLAPLHNPVNLEGIRAVKELIPEVVQVAVFDTSFHQTIPQIAYMYAIPYSYHLKHNIRRYGFHGTSHNYVSNKACQILNRDIKTQKIITCHLGNGSSIAAIDKGKSIDTSMGFTPLEGLIMGTRPGDMDIGIIPYILKREKIGISSLYAILNKQSGMLGITGISSDIREIEEAAIKRQDAKAELALNIYCYRIKKYIGAYAAILNGLDILVFTGGVGENSHLIRERICSGLDFLGIHLDQKMNINLSIKEKIISDKISRTDILVVPTDEELLIAEETMRFIQLSTQSN
jgi:acetate kinase